VSRAAQAVAKAAAEMRIQPRPLRRSDHAPGGSKPMESEQGDRPADPAGTGMEPAEPGGDAEMAKKKKAKAARKPRAKKAKAPAGPRALRTGKKGLLVLTAAALPLVLRALKHALKDGIYAEADQPLAQALADRVEQRIE
jgi:hypothetical protein